MSDPDILTHGLDDPVRLERELHEKGWRPVLMRDEVTGLPFTRWFPPRSDLPLGYHDAPGALALIGPFAEGPAGQSSRHPSGEHG